MTFLICYPGMPTRGNWLHATERAAFAEAEYLALVRGVTVTIFEVGASDAPRYIGTAQPARRPWPAAMEVHA